MSQSMSPGKPMILASHSRSKTEAQALALSSSAVKARLQRPRMTLRNSLNKNRGVFAVTVRHLSCATENPDHEVRKAKKYTVWESRDCDVGQMA